MMNRIRRKNPLVMRGFETYGRISLKTEEVTSLVRNRLREKKPETVPKHIAIIMDGNGRWAKKRGLPRQVGHSYGAKVFKTIARYCGELGVEILTVYAFSTENWKRPAEEIGALMKLFKQYLNDALNDFLEDNIVIRVLGDTTLFSDDLRELIDRCHRETANNTGLVLNIAQNLGASGRSAGR